MSGAPMPPPPLRMRTLPKKTKALELLAPAKGDHSYDRFLTLEIEQLLDQLSTPEVREIHFIADRAWRQAVRAAQLGLYGPQSRPDEQIGLLLPLVLYTAGVIGRSLEQVCLWLSTVDAEETFYELDQITDRFYAWPQEPKDMVTKLRALSSAERHLLAERTLVALRFLCLQASVSEADGQLSAATLAARSDTSQVQEPKKRRSLWQVLKDLFRVEPYEERVWPQLARPENAPAVPVDGYRLLVAEKMVDTDTITFVCSAYRFDRQHGWLRLRRLYVLGVDDQLQASFASSTEVDKLAEAWADWKNAVASVNERRYQNMLAGLEATQQQRAASQRAALEQREQLAASVEIADVLDGPTLVHRS